MGKLFVESGRKKAGMILNKVSSFDMAKFEDILSDLTEDWESKARRLQMRKRRHLKRHYYE